LGIGLLTVFDDNYPRLLRAIPDPPIALTVRGELVPENQLCVAIVGSRRASPYGLDVAHQLAFELAERGLTIVSGLARGIDRAAHEGALDASGRTIAVLGSGLQSIYPREHAQLAERIAASGAIVSEFDIHEPPHARNFPRRNRIVTGLSLGTLVVEAAEKSGSLISARHALEQDREVFAVPGPIDSKGSEGVHGLLRDGAKLVSRAEDVIEELPPMIRELLPESKRRDAVGENAHVADPDEKLVLDLLKERVSVDLDTILDACRLPTERALAALVRLELGGQARSLPDGRYRKKQ
jgi:DNA processing protein